MATSYIGLPEAKQFLIASMSSENGDGSGSGTMFSCWRLREPWNNQAYEPACLLETFLRQSGGIRGACLDIQKTA